MIDTKELAIQIFFLLKFRHFSSFTDERRQIPLWINQTLAIAEPLLEDSGINYLKREGN